MKLYRNGNTKVSALVNTVHCFSTDIKMEFELKTSGINYERWNDVLSLAGTLLPNRDLIKQIETEEYEYPGVCDFNETKVKGNERTTYCKIILKTELSTLLKID